MGWLCKNSPRNTMGNEAPCLLGLGSYAKQGGDEADLPSDVSFAHPFDLSLANHVHHLIALKRSPCRFKGKEAHPRLDHPFDEAVILLHQIVQIFDLSELDTLGKPSDGFEIRNGLGVGRILIHID